MAYIFLLTEYCFSRRPGANSQKVDGIQLTRPEHPQLLPAAHTALLYLNLQSIVVGQQQRSTGDGLTPAVKQNLTPQGAVFVVLDVIGIDQPPGRKEWASLVDDNLRPKQIILWG